MLLKKLFPFILLLLFALIFYFPVIFQGKMYATQDWGRGDLTHFSYPLHAIYSEFLKHFSLPFITDKIYSGFQLAAEGQTGIFYLPNLILFFLLPAYNAYGLSFFVVSILSSLGMFLFARALKLSLWGSLFASITFSYCMFFGAHFVHLNMIQAFSLVPWCFWIAEKMIEKKITWRWFLFFVFLHVQMFFTGHPQIALYEASAILIYVFLLSNKEKRIKKTLIVASAILLGACIAAVQLYPTYLLGKASPSTTLESAQNSIALFPYTLRDIAYFFHPAPFGDPSNNTYTILQKDGIYWENNTFAGIAVVFLFIPLFLWKKFKQKKFLWILLGSLVFCMGFLYFFYYLPPFSWFRLPQRGLVITMLFFSIISAIGFDFFLAWIKKYINTVVISLLIIFFQFAILFLISNTYNSPQSKESFVKTPETARFLQTSNDRMFSIGGVSLWEKVYKEQSFGWRGGSGKKILATNEILDPNRNAVFGIRSLDGYAKLVPLRTLAYLSLIRKGEQEKLFGITLDENSQKLLGMSGVKYIVTAKKIENIQFKKDFTNKKINTKFYVYENPHFLPEVRPLKHLEMLESTREVIPSDIVSKEWNTTAYVEDKSLVKDFSDAIQISNIKNSDQSLSFKTRSKYESSIYIAKSYNKNWQAYTKGKLLKIFPVNINSMVIVLPKGENEVVLTYVPNEFILGSYISLIGMVLAGVCAFAVRKYGAV